MAFSTAAKNTMLDALTINTVQLHSADPGASGTSNALGSKTACTFSAASSGARALASDVDFTGLGASATVAFFSAWTTSGDVFLGSGAVTGDSEANGAGEYTLNATTTTLSIT